MFPTKTISDDIFIQGTVGLLFNEKQAALNNSLRCGQLNDPFTINNSFRMNSNEMRTVTFNNEGKEEKVSVMQNENGFKVKVNDNEWRNVQVKRVKENGRFTLKTNIDGSIFKSSIVITPETITIFDKVSEFDCIQQL